jgi:hypothetical protein
MNADHIESWRNYMAEKLHERYGLEMEEALRLAAEWMASMEQEHARQRSSGSETKDPKTIPERPINITSRSALVQDEIVE